MTATDGCRLPSHERSLIRAVVGGALWTLLANACVVFQLGLVHLVGAAAVVALGFAITFRVRGDVREPIAELTPAEQIAFAVACAAAVVATSGWVQPDTGDAFRVSLSVGAADAPFAPLLRADTLHGIEGNPSRLPLHLAQSFELLGAALAWLTGTEPLLWHHRVLPPLGALGAVAANAALLRRIAPARWPAALLVLVAVLVLVGGPARGYASFGFVRMQQGSSWFLLSCVPLLVALAHDFMHVGGWRRWAHLFAANVAGVGLAGTALWAAPAVTGLALLAAAPGSARGLGRLAIGLLATGHALTCAAWLAGGGGAVASGGGGALVLGALDATFGPGPLRWASLAACVAAALAAPAGPPRRIAAALPLLAAAVFLAPWWAERAASLTAGPRAYWLVLWVVPVPALIAAGLTAPLALSRASRLLRIGLAAGLVTLFLVAVPSARVYTAENKVRFAPVALRVPVFFPDVVALVEAAPAPALVIAPLRVAAWIPTLRRHPYPLAVSSARLDAYRNVLPPGEAERRLALAGLASSAGGREVEEELVAAVDAYGIEGLWATLRVARPLRHRLAYRGFERMPTRERWDVRVRPPISLRRVPGGIR